MIKGKILIEYLDGTKEEQSFDNYFIALEKQGKMMKDKKLMRTIKILQVKAVEN